MSQQPPARDRKKLGGKNDAYYTITPVAEQLASIGLLNISPNPPRTPEQLFLRLSLSTEDQPGLNDTTLKMTIRRKGEIFEKYEEKLILWPQIAIRWDDEDYIRELRPGNLDFIADWYPFDPMSQEDDYNFEFHARLPDGRTWFAFEQTVHIKPFDWGNW